MNFIKSVKNTLIAVTLFGIVISVFTELTTGLISVILVMPVFSTVDSTSYWLDFLSAASMGLIVFYFVNCAIRGVRLSSRLLIWINALSILYFYYRYVDDSFSFLPFKLSFLSNAKLLDAVFAVPIGTVLFLSWSFLEILISKSTVEQNRSMMTGFLIDEPIRLDKHNDIFARSSFLEDLKSGILTTNNKKSSFAIGITGKWGAGKTSFLSGLRHVIEREPEVIYLKFNPWSVQESKSITAFFFQELAARLSRYDFELKDEITLYSKRLIKVYDNPTLNRVTEFLSAGFLDLPITDQYRRINESVVRIGKKIVVEIDDLDRLYAGEIIEVLRIIRNTANFGNVFFLVAFDRDYLITTLGREIVDVDLSFITKIFSLEYPLPLSNVRDIIERSFYEKISPYLSSNHMDIIGARVKSGSFMGGAELYPLVGDFLEHERDVIRFCNSFLLGYRRVAHDIYFPDFLYVSLLKYKYPSVYQILYYGRTKYLTELSSRAQDLLPINTDRLSLRLSSVKATSIEETQIYLDLNENLSHYSMTKKEVGNVMKILYDLFTPNEKNFPAEPLKRTFLFSHYSIALPSCFDRYFEYSMVGRITELEFGNLMSSDLVTIKTKIDHWLLERETTNDLRLKFEMSELPQTRGQFEKIIQSIVYFANRVLESQSINAYNNDNFLEKLGLGKSSMLNPVEAYYGGNVAEFKVFLIEHLHKNNGRNGVSFLHSFSLWAASLSTSFILTTHECEEAIRSSFLKTLENAVSFDQELFDFYQFVIRLFQELQDDPKSVIVPNETGRKVSEHFRDFILDGRLRNFLESIILPTRQAEVYQIFRWPQIIFGSDEKFISILKSRASQDFIEEFIRFYGHRDDNESRVIKFSFKYLNPSLI